MSKDSSELTKAKATHGRAFEYTSPEGKTYVFRPPGREEFDAMMGVENEKKHAATRELIADCYTGDRADVYALLDKYPYLVSGKDGLGQAIHKLAGQGAGSIRFV